jgi:hypothetical protein
MRKCVLVCILGSLAGGCTSGVQYAVSEYTGVEVKQIEVPGDDTYRIFDKPAANKMMVTSSLASAASQGFAQGLTFGAINAAPPKPRYEAAAIAWLKETGRESCRIVDGYLIQQPQWEFKYNCVPASAPAVVAAPAAKRSSAGR